MTGAVRTEGSIGRTAGIFYRVTIGAGGIKCAMVQADPIGIQQGNNHKFIYVKNRPTILIDPSGETCYTYNSIPEDLKQYVPQFALARIKWPCICNCCVGVDIDVISDGPGTIGPSVRKGYYIGFCLKCVKGA